MPNIYIRVQSKKSSQIVDFAMLHVHNLWTRCRFVAILRRVNMWKTE